MRPIAALLLAIALVSAVAAAPQTARPTAPQSANLPPLSWTCPMHPDVLEDKKGTCPICKMDLVPVRLDAFGDIGNKQQITVAYDRFVEAANDIHTSFPQQP